MRVIVWMWKFTNLLTLLTLSQVFSTKDDRPNIVFIVSDDVGYGDFSCFGHPTQEYGGVDRMASEGLRFTQAYTTAVFCSPSRAAMLTGTLGINEYI